MEKKVNIKWNRFDREDPSTFPKDGQQCLVTYKSSGTGISKVVDLVWRDFDKWGSWEYDGDEILFWSEFNVQPCTESEEQENPEMESSDMRRTVTLRELSRHPYKLDINALVAVKNALKGKLDRVENPFGDAICCVNAEAKEAFLTECANIEDRFEHRPEVAPYEFLCHIYNELVRDFAKIHLALRDAVNEIEVTIEW